MTESPDLMVALREEIRREAKAAAIEAVRAEILRIRPSQSKGPRMLSLAALTREYGVGRIVLLEMMRNGKLPVVERKCRGGSVGRFVERSIAEAALGGCKVAR